MSRTDSINPSGPSYQRSFENARLEGNSHDQSSYDRDKEALARLGKKQVLKRNFGFISMLGFTSTMLITWESVLFSFTQGLTNGGSVGLIYGYLIVWVGSMVVFLTMAELVSMAPTASGQYHWVAVLAPTSCHKFLSYLTGWLTVAGWQAFVASGTFFCATMIQGLLTLRHPETYKPHMWHSTLFFWAVLISVVGFNTIVSKALPKIEGLMFVLHVLGFFAILIPLIYMSPHRAASEVFTTFLNEGNWPTPELSFFIGLVGRIVCFLGADGAIYMSEEIKDPSRVVPRAMLYSMLLNGFMGFGMLLAAIFCTGDVRAVLTTPTKYPFMEIFREAVGSISGSTTMITIVIILCECGIIAVLASASRLTWSFARDRALPGWRHLSRVEPRTSLPLTSIAFTSSISFLLSLLGLFSPLALMNILSITVNGLFASYLLCCSLLLWRRSTGVITRFSSQSRHPTNRPDAGQITWGPFHISGALGIAINAFGCIFLIIILFFSFWPSMKSPTAREMNWSVLVTAVVISGGVFYYHVWGKKSYRGPVVEVSVLPESGVRL